MVYKLVSVIIPCFNAEQWIAEAIESCLNQTYPEIEVIIIDDSSTDQSLRIIQQYANRVTWRTINHCGGSAARNVGIALANGEYIQFLDADDYLLPEKIARQVQHLENTKADIVYGDWRYQRHRSDGTYFLDKITLAETHEDILEALLRDWWVAVAAILYTKAAIQKSQGWDATLLAAQDRDFLLSAVINGATVVYQPGCSAIYRRPDHPTVSSYSKNRWLANQCRVLEKAEQQLIKLGKLRPQYREAIASCYFQYARERLGVDYSRYVQLLDKTFAICPEFRVSSQRSVKRWMQKVMGVYSAEKLAAWIWLCSVRSTKLLTAVASRP
jgi:glycosyltransferase involved in cell wall biosynthesis